MGETATLFIGATLMLRLGVDLGGTKIEGIVMDENSSMLARERRPTPAKLGYEAILLAIRDIVAQLESKVGQTCHIGLGAPGARSSRTGFIKNSNTTCLNGKPLQQDLENILRRPVRMANDANCFTLSEALDGAARHRDVVFGVIMGTGVGGGIVVNGRALAGLQHIAGEWGHNVLEADGPQCYCGKRGCVETFLSGPGLVRDYVTHGGTPEVDAQGIVTRAANGDDLAEATMQRFLDRFGRALAVVINILDPDAVVLGGGLSNIERLFSEGRAYVAHYVFNDELRTPIVPNTHGDSSGVRGAAQLWRADE